MDNQEYEYRGVNEHSEIPVIITQIPLWAVRYEEGEEDDQNRINHQNSERNVPIADMRDG